MGTVATGTDLLSTSDRDRVLEAMAERCAVRGYAETTVEEVLERAEVGRESFDSHFSSKEDCALAALNKLVSETLARVAMARLAGAERVESLRAECSAILELMAQRPGFVRLGTIEARQGGTPRMRDAYASAMRVLALMLDRAAARAGAEGPTPGSARAALGGVEALVRREAAQGRAERLPRLLPDLMYAVLVPFVGQGEALRQAKQAARLVAEEDS